MEGEGKVGGGKGEARGGRSKEEQVSRGGKGSKPTQTWNSKTAYDVTVSCQFWSRS